MDLRIINKPKAIVVCNLAPTCDQTKDYLKSRYLADIELLTLDDPNTITNQEGDNA